MELDARVDACLRVGAHEEGSEMAAGAVVDVKDAIGGSVEAAFNFVVLHRVCNLGAGEDSTGSVGGSGVPYCCPGWFYSSKLKVHWTSVSWIPKNE
jgi:hypothetical protein